MEKLDRVPPLLADRTILACSARFYIFKPSFFIQRSILTAACSEIASFKKLKTCIAVFRYLLMLANSRHNFKKMPYVINGYTRKL
jgi:hypothetical protein